MIGIYKFTNLIDGKSYIGQSTNIHRRYLQHKNRHETNSIHHEDTYFHRQLRHYGFWNFEFEILEECTKDELDAKEAYYIQKYHTQYPNGYNKTAGGNAVVSTKIDEYTICNILDDLKRLELTELQIAKKYNLHLNTISLINLGKTWHDDSICYPIRKPRSYYIDKNTNGKRICPYCNGIMSKTSSMCIMCSKSLRASFIPDKQTLLDELNKMSFEAVAKNHNVNSNAVRKWCKKYGLSHHSSDYTGTSDQRIDNVTI